MSESKCSSKCCLQAVPYMPHPCRCTAVWVRLASALYRFGIENGFGWLHTMWLDCASTYDPANPCLAARNDFPLVSSSKD